MGVPHDKDDKGRGNQSQANNRKDMTDLSISP